MEKAEQGIHVRIISMEHQTRRYMRLAKMLTKKGFDDIHRWPGVRPTAENVATATQKGWMAPPTRYNGNVGCFLAHMTLLEYVVQSEHEQVLILEDDTEPGGADIVSKLRTFVNKFPYFHILRCNVLRGSGVIVDDEIVLTDVSTQDNINPMVWTSAMLVSKAGAAFLLSAFIQAKLDMSVLVYDRAFVRLRTKHLRQYAVTARNKYFVHIEDDSDRDPSGLMLQKMKYVVSAMTIALCAVIVWYLVTRRPRLACVGLLAKSYFAQKRDLSHPSCKLEEMQLDTGDIILVSHRKLRWDPYGVLIMPIQHILDEYTHIMLVIRHRGRLCVYDWTFGGHVFTDLTLMLTSLRQKRCYFATRRLKRRVTPSEEAAMYKAVQRCCRVHVPVFPHIFRHLKFAVTSATDPQSPSSCIEFVEYILRQANVHLSEKIFLKHIHAHAPHPSYDVLKLLV